MGDYAQNQGLRLLNQIVSAVGPIFTTNQAYAEAESLGISSRQVRWLLSRLAHGTWLARIKRGVYVVQTPLLDAEVHPFALAAALMEPSAISHWSALAYHGLTTQIPSMIQASTTQSVVTPEMRGGAAYRPRGRAVWRALNIEFEFIRVKPEHFFGFQRDWVSRWHRVAITDPERTLLDMVAHPQVFGGIRMAIETLDVHLGQLDPAKLADYALRYDVGAVLKRLGWMMETLGVADAILVPLRAYPVQTYYLLDQAGPTGGITMGNWNVRDNLRAEITHADH